MFDFPNSPTVGQTATGVGGVVYIWDGTKWASSLGNITTQSMGDVGRNLIHNPLFNVAQRGAGPFTTNGTTTVDRWGMSFVNGTESVSRVALNDSNRAQIGDEAAVYGLQAVVVGGAATASQTTLYQGIEFGVRRLSNKTVTLSFWATASSGTPKLGVSFDQSFGTGGGASATVFGVGQSVTLSTTITRYSLTFTIPSTAGKVFGTTSDDILYLNLWLSAGTNFSAASGSVGVQNSIFTFWGVQLEIGSVATPLEKPDPRYDLANCQRFFSATYVMLGGYASASGGPVIWGSATLPVTMRAAPTVSWNNATYSSGSGVTVTGAITPASVGYTFNSSAVGLAWVQATLVASADL